MGSPTVLMASDSSLASDLRSSGSFSAVVEASDVASLIAAVSGDPAVSSLGPSELLFVLSDDLRDSDTFDLPKVVSRLGQRGFRVVVVVRTGRLNDIVPQIPSSRSVSSGSGVAAVLMAARELGFSVRAADPAPAPPQPSKQSAGGWAVPERVEMEETAAPGDSRPSLPSVWDPAAPALQVPPAQPLVSAQPPAPQVPPAQPLVSAQPPAQPATVAEPAWTPEHHPVPSGPAGAPQPQSWGSPAAPAGAQVGGMSPPSADFTDNSQPPAFVRPGLAPSGAQVAPSVRSGSSVGMASSRSRRGFVMTTAVSKGGTGKSSLTLNLAAFLGMRLRDQGRNVVIVDANYQQADTGKYLDVYRPNITNLASNPALLSESRIMEALVHRPDMNLSALLGPATPDEANPGSISPGLYLQAVELLRRQFDYVLIDTPVAEKYHDLFSSFALPVADYIVVPVAPSFQTLHNADNWIRAAVVAPRHDGGAGISPERVGIVLNRAEEGVGCTEDDVRRTLASWNYLGQIPETVEWKAANNANEVIAKENYAELSNAFANVLYAVTGEDVLQESIAPVEEKRSFLGRIFGR